MLAIIVRMDACVDAKKDLSGSVSGPTSLAAVTEVNNAALRTSTTMAIEGAIRIQNLTSRVCLISSLSLSDLRFSQRSHAQHHLGSFPGRDNLGYAERRIRASVTPRQAPAEKVLQHNNNQWWTPRARVSHRCMSPLSPHDLMSVSAYLEGIGDIGDIGTHALWGQRGHHGSIRSSRRPPPLPRLPVTRDLFHLVGPS